MKRRDLLRHLRQHGCRFVREGSDHSIWENPANRADGGSATSRDSRLYGRAFANNWEFLYLLDQAGVGFEDSHSWLSGRRRTAAVELPLREL